MKILAIDIGNTTIQFAQVDARGVTSVTAVDVNQKTQLFKAELMRVTKKLVNQKNKINKAVVCSVVPHLSLLVKRTIAKHVNIPVYIIGEDVRVPLTVNYKPKSSVGQDRLVGAYAAKKKYGAPVIIIDLGTAITFDVINRKGEYDGGIIVPGIRLSAESLYNKTAMLPNINTNKGPQALIGKTTKESILSGLFNGYGALCEGLIVKLRKGALKNAKVIITGGHTLLIKKHIKKQQISVIDNYLVLRGIHTISKLL